MILCSNIIIGILIVIATRHLSSIVISYTICEITVEVQVIYYLSRGIYTLTSLYWICETYKHYLVLSSYNKCHCATMNAKLDNRFIELAALIRSEIISIHLPYLIRLHHLKYPSST